MANLFNKNSYQILGLDISSTQKEIVKRAKEIQNYLLIDEHPEYPTDISFYRDKRTSDNVKESLQKLSQPEKRIKEYFFWFEIRNDIDEKAIHLINKSEHNEALELWRAEMEKSGSKSYFYKKNLAITSSILLDAKGQKNHLEKSLSYWRNLLKDDDFWTTFFKNYKLFDDLNTREDILTSFKNSASKYLADFYLEVSKKYEDKSIFEAYYQIFKTKGSKVDETFLRDIYKKINDECDILNKMIRKDIEKIPPETFSEINSTITKIKRHFKGIKDLGLFDSSEVKVERDNVAEVLLSLSIFLHNDHNLSEEALDLAKDAIKISGTDSMKGRIEKNIVTIQEAIDYKDHEEQFNLILNTAKEGDVDKAINLINVELQKDDVPLSLKEVYIKTKNTLEERVKTHGKPIKNAPTMYCINGCGTRMYGDILYFVLLFIPIIPWARYSVQELGDGRYNFFGKLDLPQWQKAWKYIGLVVIGLFLMGLFSSSSNNSSSTTPKNSNSTTETVCSDDFCRQKYFNSIFSYKDTVNNKCICGCPDGNTMNKALTGCITYTEACKEQFGADSYWSGEFEGEQFLCN
jgi:hypothetical protein